MSLVKEKDQQTFTYQDLCGAIESFDERYADDVTPTHYFGFPIEPVLRAEGALLTRQTDNTAYFSMEFGIAPSIYNTFITNRPMNKNNNFYTHEVFSNDWLCDYLFKIRIDKMLDIPIYGGGLGVLAGDAIKSSSDHGLPVTGVGVLWNKGYFKQRFWYKHGQIPEEMTWDPYTYPGLIPLKNRVTIETKEGPLHLRSWKYYIYSYDRTKVCPIILMDSNIPENSPKFQKLTDQLYRSDDIFWKIYQRVILGIGGMKTLKNFQYRIECFHLNEGHAAFALIENEIAFKQQPEKEDKSQRFIYTCHTPVVAGHDRFIIDDLRKVLSDQYVDAAIKHGKEHPDSNQVNLTYMCLSSCEKFNAVAQKHGQIMRLQFPQFANRVKAITNGVHLHTWLSESFKDLFDRYGQVSGDWRKHPQNLACVRQLKQDNEFRRSIFEAHQINKRNLLKIINHWNLKEDVLTIGWARRIAGYKRPSLIFHNIKNIVKLAHEVGPLQIILAGKAHPNDNIGAAHIDEILDHIDQLNGHKHVIKVLILENYDTYFGKLLSNSVDVWLNNPLPPFEASGTSGMKAILNGVLQLSTLDGWVVEAADKDIGWIFGYAHSGADIGSEKDLKLEEDSKALCQTLEQVIKLYYKTYNRGIIDPQSVWIDKMINCVEQGSFFNTHRMIDQYYKEMWKKDQS